METNRKVSGYLTSNPTDFWVLVVDGLFGVFETKAEAEHWHNIACPENECIENVAFGSVVLISPRYVARSLGGYDAESIDPSLAIDIKRYIQKRPERLVERCDALELGQLIKHKTGQYLRKRGSAFLDLPAIYKDLSGRILNKRQEA